MNVLIIGDAVGSSGCEFLRAHLPAIKRRKSIDIVIVNGENSADGNGITPASADFLLESGIDVITTGNHVYRRPEFHGYINESGYVIRPANYPEDAPGKGHVTLDLGYTSLTVVNIMGTVFMESLDCPFRTMDKILNEINSKNIIVDIHAEATSEKKGLGFYLDGRVSAVVGTHTHVQTSDEQLLPKGTAYITDIGMTGPRISVLGIEPSLAISKMKGKLPVRFAAAAPPCEINGVVIEIDHSSGRAKSIERILIRDSADSISP